MGGVVKSCEGVREGIRRDRWEKKDGEQKQPNKGKAETMKQEEDERKKRQKNKTN